MRMPATLVFGEPRDDADDESTGSLASWLRRHTSREAKAARRMVNRWYAGFPDRGGMVLSRLRGDDNNEILQAIDELQVHHLLSASCDVCYEEDETSPDFRLYRSREYVAGVETYTLFEEQGFSSEVSRNSRLTGELDRRVRPRNWWIHINRIKWTGEARVVDIARWLNAEIAELPIPTPDLDRKNYPTATYRGRGVELRITFLPRRRRAPPAATEPIVMIGPVVAKFMKPNRRLRTALSKKAGSKYEHRDRPFAIAVSVRNYSCDVEDFVNALYGDDAIAFEAGNPDSARPHRMGNGFFGISRGAPEGKNRRVSCVYALFRGWYPNSRRATSIYRFDNPFAQTTFPDDLIVPTRRFRALPNASAISMVWEPSLV
jgi:hypothetical protein